jgi:hypothetical protein
MYREDDDTNTGNAASLAESKESKDSPIGYARAKTRFKNYIEGYSGRLTLNGLREGIKQFPEIDIGKKILKYDVLHRYVGGIAQMPPEGGRRTTK